MKPKQGVFGTGCGSESLDHGVLAVGFDLDAG